MVLSLETCFLMIVVLYHYVSGFWKVADFGMTVEGHSTRGITTQYQSGTPCYRAPELFANKLTYTTKVDVWAIGCIMFEFMTRKKAFKGDVAVLKYAAGIENELDFSDSRFSTSANTLLEEIIRQLL